MAKVKNIDETKWSKAGTIRLTILFRNNYPDDIELFKRVIRFCQDKYPRSKDSGARQLVKDGLEKNGY